MSETGFNTALIDLSLNSCRCITIHYLQVLLGKGEWDTRVAAAQGLEAILAKVPQFVASEEGEVDRLKLASFDLEQVLRTERCLMGSEGREYEGEEEVAPGLQKKRIEEKLGLDMMQKLGGRQESLIDDSDLERPEATVVPTTGEMSSREKNRLKRKAKVEAKAAAQSKEKEQSSTVKKTRIETVMVAQPESDAVLMDSVEVEEEECSDKPVASFCSRLSKALTSPRWEERHGAATGLREVVRRHGAGVGHGWLEDILLRLLTALALDRFGDFVGDTVVAPVRESAAQALGVCVPHLQEEAVLLLARLLLLLAGQEGWEARHGALLATKYLLAARSDLAPQLLPLLFPRLLTGLQDPEDDVVAVAASALHPTVPCLVNVLPHQLPVLAEQLWSQLEQPDDLTSSTQATMALLAELLAQENGPSLCLASPSLLPRLVPRLYPYLCHSSSTVRQATLSTLLTLSSAPGLAASWLPPCAPLLLRHLYQRALLEHRPAILTLLERVWASVLQHSPLQPLLMAACPWFGPWLQLLATPPSLPLEPSLLLPGPPGVRFFLGGGQGELGAGERARHTGARLLGKLACYIVRPVEGQGMEEESPLELLLARVFVPQLGSDSAHQHIAVSLVVRAWLEGGAPPGLASSPLAPALLACLAREQPYSELAGGQARLAEDASDFIASLRHYGIPVEGQPSVPLTPEQIHLLVTSTSDQMLARARLPPRNLATIQERRDSLATSLSRHQTDQTNLQLSTLATLAGALAGLEPEALPAKLNPVLKPLMEAVKREEREEWQQLAAASLARVIAGCRSRQPSPSDKVIKNLCSFVCSNPEAVPLVDLAHLHSAVDPQMGVLSLHYIERKAERASRTKKGRKKQGGLGTAPAPLQATTDIDSEEEVARAEVQRRGTTAALREIAKFFGAFLEREVSVLWQLSMTTVGSREEGGVEPQQMVNALEVVRLLVPALHPSLHTALEHLLPRLLELVSWPLAATR